MLSKLLNEKSHLKNTVQDTIKRATVFGSHRSDN